MANYPYVSGPAAVITAFAQLRKGFPPKVDASYLQRNNIAPANESYIISILKFLGLIDDEGNRVEGKTDYFFGNDDSFKAGLENVLRESYAQVFSDMGDGALDAEKSALTHWFRSADKTSDLVGQRQATTFQTLAALAGHGDLPAVRSNAAKKASAPAVKKAPKQAPAKETPAKKVTEQQPPADTGERDTKTKTPEVGLNVRIEVNLPAGGDADTYDAIFASIKKHLMS